MAAITAELVVMSEGFVARTRLPGVELHRGSRVDFVGMEPALHVTLVIAFGVALGYFVVYWRRQMRL